MATYSGPNITLGNLVLEYDAGNPKSYPGSGTNLTDIGGSLINMSLSNTTFESGTALGTINFNGTSSIGTAIAPSLSFSGDFTFEFWLYKTANTGSLLELNLYTNGILIRPWNSDDLYINGTGYGNLQVPLNQWSHLVVTRIGTAVTTYTNTVQILSATVSGTVNTSSNVNLYLGRSTHTPGQFFTGKFSTCSILNGKGLSATEVIANYNNNRARYGI